MFKIELSMKTYDDFIILIIKIILEIGKKNAVCYEYNKSGKVSGKIRKIMLKRILRRLKNKNKYVEKALKFIVLCEKRVSYILKI